MNPSITRLIINKYFINKLLKQSIFDTIGRNLSSLNMANFTFFGLNKVYLDKKESFGEIL